MDAGLGGPVWARQIRRSRQSKAWSQQELTKELNRLDPQARVDSNTVSRWERGIYKPGPFYTRLLCRCFGLSPAELALLGSDEEDTSVDRRNFLRKTVGLGALSAVVPALPTAWERIGHAIGRLGGIDHEAVKGLEQVTMALERLDQQIAPAALIGPAMGHLDTVIALLKGSMASTLRSRLCSIAAETAGLVACAKSEAGDIGGADSSFKIALEAAREAGDRALGVFLVGYYTAAHRPYQAEPELRLRRFTDGDLGFRMADATPSAALYFAARAADTNALLGNTDACLRSLDRAEAALQRMGQFSPERPRVPLSSWDARWLAGERGTSLARLGRSEQSREALDRALEPLGTGPSKDRLWLLIARARTFAHDSEPEETCRLATEALAGAVQMHYQPVIHELLSFRQELASWRATAAVRELDEQLAAAAA